MSVLEMFLDEVRDLSKRLQTLESKVEDVVEDPDGHREELAPDVFWSVVAHPATYLLRGSVYNALWDAMNEMQPGADPSAELDRLWDRYAMRKHKTDFKRGSVKWQLQEIRDQVGDFIWSTTTYKNSVREKLRKKVLEYLYGLIEQRDLIWSWNEKQKKESDHEQAVDAGSRCPRGL